MRCPIIPCDWSSFLRRNIQVAARDRVKYGTVVRRKTAIGHRSAGNSRGTDRRGVPFKLAVIVDGVVSIPPVANAVSITGSVASTRPIIRIPRRKFVIRPRAGPVASHSWPISNLTRQRSRAAITEARSVVVSQSATRTVDVPQATSRSISDLTW